MVDAWDEMNEAAPDYDIGGAIEMSEYDTNMSHWQREDYKANVVSELQTSYDIDPHKGELGFKDWMDNINWDLYDERFKGWDDIMNMSDSDRKYFWKDNNQEYKLRANDGALRKLADLHTGDFKDLPGIAKSSEMYYGMRDKPLK